MSFFRSNPFINMPGGINWQNVYFCANIPYAYNFNPSKVNVFYNNFDPNNFWGITNLVVITSLYNYDNYRSSISNVMFIENCYRIDYLNFNNNGNSLYFYDRKTEYGSNYINEYFNSFTVNGSLSAKNEFDYINVSLKRNNYPTFTRDFEVRVMVFGFQNGGY